MAGGQREALMEKKHFQTLKTKGDPWRKIKKKTLMKGKRKRGHTIWLFRRLKELLQKPFHP